MTLILKLDLDMIKMYLYTKNEVCSFSSSKVIASTDTQTDMQTHRQTWLKLLLLTSKGWREVIFSHFVLVHTSRGVSTFRVGGGTYLPRSGQGGVATSWGGTYLPRSGWRGYLPSQVWMGGGYLPSQVWMWGYLPSQVGGTYPRYPHLPPAQGRYPPPRVGTPTQGRYPPA